MAGVCNRLEETSEGVGWEGTSEGEGGRREEEGDWGEGCWGVGWEGWGGEGSGVGVKWLVEKGERAEQG